jgi:hypothetical protein
MLVAVPSISQTLTEYEIYSDNTIEDIKVYNFIYDKNTGNYCYLYYNAMTNKYVINSKDGESGEFDYISVYDIRFDSKGSYYALVSNYNEDDSLEYFLIANGETVSKFQKAESYSSFVDKNDDFKFVYSEGDSVRICTYSINNELTTSEKYFAAKPIYRYKEESEYDIALGQEDLFEDTNGNYGFVVSDGVTSSILFGDNVIKTPYTDINSNSLVYDKQGILCYIAKMEGKFYENKGREFIVQGDKKHKEFDYVYLPVLFDKNNNPVYNTVDSTQAGHISKLVIGDDYQKIYSDASKTKLGADYDGGIYLLNIDSDDNITYYGAIMLKPDSEDLASEHSIMYNVVYVVNGVEKKFYLNSGLWKFNKNERGLITFVTDELGNKTRLLLTKNNKQKIVSKMDYNEIPDYGFINSTNKIYYVGVIFGDWTKKIKDQYFIYIDNKRIGKYEAIIFQEQTGDFSIIKFSSKGNYAFVIQESETDIGDENFEYYTYVVTDAGRQAPIINFETKKKSFDFIENLFYTRNNKLFCTAGIYNYEKSSDQYQIMVDNKPLDEIYNSIDKLQYDEEKNVVSFMGSRAGSIYEVKVFF